MNRTEILNKLIEILIDIKGEVKIDETTALIKAGVLDSLELINYLTQIEETYGISISLDQLSELQLGIVSNMIDYLINNVK